MNAQVKCHCKSCKTGKLSPAVAKEMMIKNKQFRRRIKNLAPPWEEMDAALRKAWKDINVEDERRKMDADMNKTGCNRFILKTCKSGGRKKVGTEDAMNNLLIHVAKGCCRDPFPIDDMNIPLDPDDPHTIYLRNRGTSAGENCHKLVNKMLNAVGSMSAKLAHCKVMLFVYRWNIDKDNLVHKPVGKGPMMDCDWCLKEIISKTCTRMKSFQGFHFPPELPPKYFEPVGIHYQRYKESERATIELAELHATLCPAAWSADFVPLVVPPVAALPRDVPFQETAQK